MESKAPVAPPEDKMIRGAPVKKWSDYTVAELRDIAQERGVEGYYSMRKAELIKALKG